MNREGHGHYIDLTVAQTESVSGSFQLPRWSVFVGVYIPDADAANVTMEVSKDDSTFVPILDDIDGEDAVILASGQDPAYIDISRWIASIPLEWYIRFKFSAAQNTAALTLHVCFRP